MERRNTAQLFSDRTRRLLRWAIGLSLPFLGLLTVVLFTATACVVPEGFTSWHDLGCNVRLNQPGPILIGITQCGRAYITMESPAVATGQIEFRDLSTSALIGTSDLRHEGYAFSKSKKNLLHVDVSGGVLTDLNTGKILATFDINGPIQFCINVKANSALLRSDTKAEVWDMETGQRLKIVSRRREPLSFGFANSANEPKCITFVQPAGQPELRDEASGQIDLILRNADNLYRMRPFTLSPDCSLIAMPSGKLITIRTLSKDSLDHAFTDNHDAQQVGCTYSGSALTRFGSKLKFSLNNLWLTQEYSAFHPLVETARNVNADLGQWLANWLPADNFVDLRNLETGQIWQRIPAGLGVAFSEDDSRLITFGAKGRYIWSVPPRVQWFTPWALVALASWLSLALCWWKLRRRTAVEPTLRPMT